MHQLGNESVKLDYLKLMSTYIYPKYRMLDYKKETKCNVKLLTFFVI